MKETYKLEGDGSREATIEIEWRDCDRFPHDPTEHFKMHFEVRSSSGYLDGVAGYLKWDGCVNFDALEDHACCYLDFEFFADVMRAIYQIGSRSMSDSGGADAKVRGTLTKL